LILLVLVDPVNLQGLMNLVARWHLFALLLQRVRHFPVARDFPGSPVVQASLHFPVSQPGQQIRLVQWVLQDQGSREILMVLVVHYFQLAQQAQPLQLPR